MTAATSSRMQFVRYLLVGGLNTLLGTAIGLGVTWAVMRVAPQHGYIAVPVLANLINITVSYLMYKWLVFKTRGGYLQEWLRALAVYIIPVLLQTFALPVFKTLLQHHGYSEKAATYLGVLLLTPLAVVYSFFGNRKFTFRSREPVQPAA